MPKKIKKNADSDWLYSDPLVFRARAQEELKRAKRYATFVSMVSIDLSHIDAVSDIEKYSNYDDFILSFRKLLRGSIRETDLLSISGRNCVLLLLMDTPREGAMALVERLKKALRYFMADNVKSPLNWRVPMKEYCFPTSSGDDFSIQSFVDKIDE